MNKKYKSSTMFGLFMAVIGLGLVIKTQVTDSPFIQVNNQTAVNEKTTLSQSQAGAKLTLLASSEDGYQQEDVVGVTPKINQVKSLAGTQVRGNLRVDAEGNLIVEKEIKELFDYFLNVSGEIPRDKLIEKIKQGIADYLADPAQSQALKIFDDYLEYQMALQQEINSGLYNITPGNLGDLEATYRSRSQLRSFHLGNEVATAFFEEEEARDFYTVEKLRVKSNAGLTEAERQAELTALESTLPESHRNVLNKQRNREVVRSKINDMRSENASIYDLKQEWSKHYDSEAVNRFVELEVSRNDWNRRFNEYLQRKESLADKYTAQEDYMQAVSQLKSSMFDAKEARRVSVREALASK